MEGCSRPATESRNFHSPAGAKRRIGGSPCLKIMTPLQKSNASTKSQSITSAPRLARAVSYTAGGVIAEVTKGQVLTGEEIFGRNSQLSSLNEFLFPSSQYPTVAVLHDINRDPRHGDEEDEEADDFEEGYEYVDDDENGATRRQRNTAAAKRSRQRKAAKFDVIQATVNKLQTEHYELEKKLSLLKEEKIVWSMKVRCRFIWYWSCF